jgi:hypothetical protein
MSDYKDDLQNLAQIEDGSERLAAAARLDAIFDELPDVRSQLKEKELEEIRAAKEAAEVERDQYRDRFVSMYFTSPEQAKRDQAEDIQRDARPEGIKTLFKFRQGY